MIDQGHYLLARSVESAVFQCLMLAYNLHQQDPNHPDIHKWEMQAEKLDQKFRNEKWNQQKLHYSSVIERYKRDICEASSQ